MGVEAQEISTFSGTILVSLFVPFAALDQVFLHLLFFHYLGCTLVMECLQCPWISVRKSHGTGISQWVSNIHLIHPKTRKVGKTFSEHECSLTVGWTSWKDFMICIIVMTVTMTNSPYFQFSLSSSISSPFIWLCIQIQAACDSHEPWLHNFHGVALDSSFTSPHKTLGTQQCIKPFCYTSRHSGPRCSNVLPLAAFKWKGCVQRAKTQLHLFPESVFIPWV